MRLYFQVTMTNSPYQKSHLYKEQFEANKDYVKRICIEFYKTFTTPDYAERYIELKKCDWALTELKERKMILDIGCGKPVDAIRAALLGCYYIGVDISSEELLQGKRFLKDVLPELWYHVNFIVADATRLPFRDCVFDVSTSYSAIEHVPSSLRERWICEMARVTKKGADVVVTLQNKLSPCYLFLPFRVIDINALAPPKIINLMAQYILYWLSKVFSPLKKFLVLREDYYEDFVTPAYLFKLLSSHGLYPLKFDASSLYYWGYAPPGLSFTKITLRIDKAISKLEKSNLFHFLKYFCLRFGYHCVKIGD
jgi:ubiquinone/menaquinone biosynthesis C-methylase UbiE